MGVWFSLRHDFNNSSLSMHKTRANLLCVLQDYCCKDASVKRCEEHITSDEINEKQQIDSDLFCSEDNGHFNELSCNKGTFDDEIDYYLGKADQDKESHKVCNEDLIAKSDFNDLSANNSPDNINSCSSTICSKDNIYSVFKVIVMKIIIVILSLLVVILSLVIVMKIITVIIFLLVEILKIIINLIIILITVILITIMMMILFVLVSSQFCY